MLFIKYDIIYYGLVTTISLDDKYSLNLLNLLI